MAWTSGRASGELVTVKAPRAIDTPNSYGETWVAGNWLKTGVNDRGGLTVTDRDANPETILVGDPLDGTDNPDQVKLGDYLADITGVIIYQYGFYYILPQTATQVTKSLTPEFPPPTTLTSSGKCGGITMGQYNVENLTPRSGSLDDIASQIVTCLKTPDILFIQEIQDNSGSSDNGVVDANTTITALVTAIKSAGSTVNYDYVDIDPVNDQDGGEPGGNIRVAYLYNPAVVRLRTANPGSSNEAVQVQSTSTGPELSLNPGRIDPSNAAWENSRKLLVAAWETLDGKNKFFTVNVHWTSKDGSSSLQGDPRPPINGGVDQRNAQAQVTGEFIAQILKLDPLASVVSAGDYNEFSFVELMETFAKVSGLRDLDVAAFIPPVQRYTYVFDMNTQQLDHMYVSNKIALRLPKFEHVHVSSWVYYDDQVSDHDPSVAKLNVCA